MVKERKTQHFSHYGVITEIKIGIPRIISLSCFLLLLEAKFVVMLAGSQTSEQVTLENLEWE